MPQHLSILRCSQTTAFLIFTLTGSLFVVTGCAQLYRTIGMSEDQVLDQVEADQQVKEQILGDIRHTTTQIITTALAGIGAIASGFLAKWLGTERKLTKILITGIETADQEATKESVAHKAALTGLEPKLNARVKSLT